MSEWRGICVMYLMAVCQPLILLLWLFILFLLLWLFFTTVALSIVLLFCYSVFCYIVILLLCLLSFITVALSIILLFCYSVFYPSLQLLCLLYCYFVTLSFILHYSCFVYYIVILLLCLLSFTTVTLSFHSRSLLCLDCHTFHLNEPAGTTYGGVEEKTRRGGEGIAEHLLNRCIVGWVTEVDQYLGDVVPVASGLG